MGKKRLPRWIELFSSWSLSFTWKNDAVPSLKIYEHLMRAAPCSPWQLPTKASLDLDIHTNLGANPSLKHPLVNSSVDISPGSLFGLLAALIWFNLGHNFVHPNMGTHQIKLRNFQWDFSRLVAQSSYDCGHNQSNGPCGSCQRHQLGIRKCVSSFWGD